jgi:agmatine/peptidylarginine deiminase
LNVFSAAFEDRQVVPIDCSGIIGFAGAIHCVVMHVPSMAGALFLNGFETP